MMRRVRRVPKAAVRAMHAAAIGEHGGGEGIRDAGLLSSGLASPPNKRAHGATSASLFDLAAAYGVAIVKNHPFIDGNKRVALMVMYVFLEINGYPLNAPEVEAVEVMLRLAAGGLDEKGLSRWLTRNSARTREQD